MKRHIRDNYYVVGEGIYTREQGRAICQRPSTTASLRKFRFSRMGPRGQALDDALREALANAMMGGFRAAADSQFTRDIPVMAGLVLAIHAERSAKCRSELRGCADQVRA